MILPVKYVIMEKRLNFKDKYLMKTWKLCKDGGV